MAEWIGRIIDGRYVVESILGSGGMGVVLRTRHKFTGAQVAVKMLHADLQLDEQLEARFLAEARAPNAIGHAGIVQVLDAGRTPEGELYLAMELLAGQPMRLAVSHGLGAPTIRRITLELLDALAAAHARGFVHRDLKPENVFLAEPSGTVKLLDFGIAKVLAGDLGGAPKTAAGVVLGTLAYMAPEQLADARGVDARADLWAIGVMLYEMLSGRLPFRANTVEQMFVKLATEQPDSIRTHVSDIAPPIEAFFQRALARDPQARFGSAVEMAAALAQLPLVSPTPPVRAAAPVGGAMTAATGYTAGTAATGYAAGTAATGYAANTAVPVTPAPAPAPHAEPANRSRMIGFALAGVAALAIVAAIVVATRSDKPHPARTDLVASHDEVPAAAPLDALYEAPPPSPTPTPEPAKPHPKTSHPTTPAPTPPTPAPTPAPAPAPPPAPPAPAPATMTCKASCAWLDSCHLRAANCLDDCTTSQLHNCMDSIGNDCDRFAQCYMKPLCGGVGNGNATCAATFACQTSHCKFGDTTCGCACIAGAAFSNLSEILSVDGCLLSCGANQACIQQKCMQYINRCNSQ